MKKLIQLFLMSMALSLSFAGKAQTAVTVADGTQTGWFPINSEKLLSRPVTLQTQMLYQASMLTSLLNTTITKMEFYSPIANETWGGITGTVKVMTTTVTSLGSIQNTSSATTVYTGMVAITGNLLEFTFSSPFTYTGDNLLIDVVTGSTNVPTTTKFYGVTATTNSSRVYGAGTWPYPGNINEGSSFLPKVKAASFGAGIRAPPEQKPANGR